MIDRCSQFYRNQRAILAQRLHELLASKVVSKAEFSRENDVSLESIDTLVQRERGDDSVLGGLTSNDDYLVSESYQRALSEAINRHLDESLRETK